MARTKEFPIKFQFALSEQIDAAIHEWRRQQPKPPNRSEAIRTLIMLGIHNANELAFEERNQAVSDHRKELRRRKKMRQSKA